MSSNDRKFCKYIIAQLDRPENKHFREPFEDTFNLRAYRDFARHADINSIKNDVTNDFYGSLNEFREDFQRIVNNCKAVEKDNKGLYYDKANDLQHHLVKLFEQKKSLYARWNKEREQEHDQEQDTAQNTAQGAAQGAAQNAAAAATAQAALSLLSPAAASRPPVPAPRPSPPRHPSLTQTLPHRFSATPVPSHRLTNNSQGRAAEVQASNTRASAHSSRADSYITSREVGETLDHHAELRQARVGKKRAASSDNISTGSKRARQEAPKYKYT